MKRSIFFILLISLMILSACSLNESSSAHKAIYGGTMQEGNFFIVYGMGVPSPTAKSKAMEKITAIDAAKLDAEYNLTAILYGFTLKGGISVKNYALKNKEVSMHLKAFVRNLVFDEWGFDEKNSIGWAKIKVPISMVNSAIFKNELYVPGKMKDKTIPSVKKVVKEKKEIEVIKTTDVSGKPKEIRMKRLPYVWPVNGSVKREYGWQNGKFYPYIEINTHKGERVRDARDGVVYAINGNIYTGYTVLIEHPDGWSTEYGPLRSVSIKRGNKINRGDVIGKSENSLLKFSIRHYANTVDPLQYLPDAIAHLKPPIMLKERFSDLIRKVKYKRPDLYLLTAYTAGPESTGKTPNHPLYGITACGKRVKDWYTVAADPQVGFGTVYYIPYFKDKPNGGIFVVEDRGSKIKGKHLDVFMRSLRDALRFGAKRNQPVYILGKIKM